MTATDTTNENDNAPFLKKIKKGKSILTKHQEQRIEQALVTAAPQTNVMTPEEEAFVNGADVISKGGSEQITSDDKPQKTSRVGRPASPVTKRKVTFDIAEDLIAQIDQCASYFGMTRAAFCAQAVMQRVRETQKSEELPHLN